MNASHRTSAYRFNNNNNNIIFNNNNNNNNNNIKIYNINNKNNNKKNNVYVSGNLAYKLIGDTKKTIQK